MLIFYPAAGCASVWASAGTTSSTRPSDRTSVPEAPARRSRSGCFAACSRNLSSTSRAASTGLTEPPSCRSRRGPSRYGLVDLARSGVRPGRPAGGRLHLLRRRHRPRRRYMGTAARPRRRPRQIGRGLRRGLRGASAGRRWRAIAEIDAWREAGGTHVSVVTMGLGLDSVDGHIDYLASVAAALSLS